MTEIKRFDMRGNTWPSDDGSIVSYKDHAAIVAAKDARIAALQEQVRSLAAEVSECRRFVGEELVPESGIQFAALSTERSDAFISEIRAQAVDEFAEYCRGKTESLTFWLDVSSAAEEFAARIRAGEQP